MTKEKGEEKSPFNETIVNNSISQNININSNGFGGKSFIRPLRKEQRKNMREIESVVSR